VTDVLSNGDIITYVDMAASTHDGSITLRQQVPMPLIMAIKDIVMMYAQP